MAGIWGKLIGCCAGFTVAGVWGAVVGTAAGHVADRGMGGRRRSDFVADTMADGAADGRDAAFAVAVVTLGARMRRHDDRLSPREVAALRRVLDVPAGRRRNVARILEAAHRGTGAFDEYARRVDRLLADNPEVLNELVDALLDIAGGDRPVTDTERAFVDQVTEIFGIGRDAIERIGAARTRQDADAPPADDPYTVLGISTRARDREIRAAWRRLIRETHPDALMARGMPRDFVAVASEKIAAINAAYDEIRRQRGNA